MAIPKDHLSRAPNQWVEALVTAAELGRLERSLKRSGVALGISPAAAAAELRDRLETRLRSALGPECSERDDAGLSRAVFAALVEQAIRAQFARRQRLDRSVHRALFDMSSAALDAGSGDG